MSWLEQVAPTIASALGGPLGGIAYEVVSKVFNISSDSAKQMLEDGKMTSDQIAQVKVAEIQLKQMEEQLGLNFEQLAVQDRSSARAMESVTKSWVPPTLSLLVTVGFFGILSALMFGYAQKSDELMIMLGSLGTAWTGIISFYFGSSAGSQRKDELLHQSTPITDKP